MITTFLGQIYSNHGLKDYIDKTDYLVVVIFIFYIMM